MRPRAALAAQRVGWHASSRRPRRSASRLACVLAPPSPLSEGSGACMHQACSHSNWSGGMSAGICMRERRCARARRPVRGVRLGMRRTRTLTPLSMWHSACPPRDSAPMQRSQGGGADPCGSRIRICSHTQASTTQLTDTQASCLGMRPHAGLCATRGSYAEASVSGRASLGGRLLPRA